MRCSPSRLATAASAVALCLSLSGCYTTTIRSGLPPAPATLEWQERWHHGVVFGMGEVSGPYALREICPQGWSEVTTETSFPNAIATIFTSSVYSPQTVTVRCAAAAPMLAAAPVAPASPVTAPAAPPQAVPPPVPPGPVTAPPSVSPPSAEPH
jgi:hypothetical protein